MKKLFLSTLLLALPLLVNAYDFAVANTDGVPICYNYINNGTELAVVKGIDYHGIVNIPEEVTYMSRTRKVTSIGDYAFSYCGGLTSVTIPNSVTDIGVYAFQGCSGLTSVHITDLAAWIKIPFNYFYSNPLYYAHHLFLNGEEIKDLVIPNSVTNIGNYAFSGCSGMTSVTIPNSVTSIGSDAFLDCYGLTSVYITDLAAWCKISFSNYTSNPLYYGHHLYINGEEIKDLVIPNSITIIENHAFRNCSSLTSVTIPNSVSSIGNRVFYNCTGLTSVISKIENPCFIDAECFPQDVFYNTTLYVPKSTTEKYKSTDYWSKFVFIEESEPGSSTQPEEKKCATPSISYANKKLTFSCNTEVVEYHYTITDTDIKSAVANSIDLSATYEISVYATKSGYTNSDVATATLVWTDAVFTETTPSTSSAKAIAESNPVLISAQNGTITVRGEQNGLPLTVYTADGKMLGSATMKDGQASISTNLQRGEIAIVKVGSKSVKIIM